jgi:hypothetical protein
VGQAGVGELLEHQRVRVSDALGLGPVDGVFAEVVDGDGQSVPEKAPGDLHSVLGRGSGDISRDHLLRQRGSLHRVAQPG